MLGLAVMGYHPGLEDDGVYLTAVKSNLNPALYPHDAEVLPLQIAGNFFDKWVAGFVRWTGIPVATPNFCFQFASIALIVFGCWAIARRLFPEAAGAMGRRCHGLRHVHASGGGHGALPGGSASAPAQLATAIHSAGGRADTGKKKVAGCFLPVARVFAASHHGGFGHLLLFHSDHDHDGTNAGPAGAGWGNARKRIYGNRICPTGLGLRAGHSRMAGGC
jgi:hypothetical protein